jgi:hypothetical protein
MASACHLTCLPEAVTSASTAYRRRSRISGFLAGPLALVNVLAASAFVDGLLGIH